jgi:hypothetical protein
MDCPSGYASCHVPTLKCIILSGQQELTCFQQDVICLMLVSVHMENRGKSVRKLLGCSGFIPIRDSAFPIIIIMFMGLPVPSS